MSEDDKKEDEVEDLYEILKEVKVSSWNLDFPIQSPHSKLSLMLKAFLQEPLLPLIKNWESKMCKLLLPKYSLWDFWISCARLGLTSLALLWMRDQDELLQEMIDKGMNVILIKVAAAGLEPEKHLGKTITELKPHFEKIVFWK